jgi:hypothetical protein
MISTESRNEITFTVLHAQQEHFLHQHKPADTMIEEIIISTQTWTLIHPRSPLLPLHLPLARRQMMKRLGRLPSQHCGE